MVIIWIKKELSGVADRLDEGKEGKDRIKTPPRFLA